MNKLKIGDEVVQIQQTRWMNQPNYIFKKVARLTKTQAVLENGDKLINEAIFPNWNKKDLVGFLIYGDRYNYYQFVTDEIIVLAKLQKQKNIVEKWFSIKNFTIKEKTTIYKLLK